LKEHDFNVQLLILNFDFCHLIVWIRECFIYIEELQILNQSLRENDKVKEDALAHLSDQLLVLSERIQQLERKQII